MHAGQKHTFSLTFIIIIIKDKYDYQNPHGNSKLKRSSNGKYDIILFQSRSAYGGHCHHKREA